MLAAYRRVMGRASRGEATAQSWERVCAYDDLEPDVGVAALVRGRGIAVFRTASGRVYAVGNRDPYSGSQAMARGIVGVRDGSAFVAAPSGKQVFDLATGIARDDPGTQLPAYATRVTDGVIEVAVPVRA